MKFLCDKGRYAVVTWHSTELGGIWRHSSDIDVERLSNTTGALG
jgi:hypothetical protein